MLFCYLNLLYSTCLSTSFHTHFSKFTMSLSVNRRTAYGPSDRRAKLQQRNADFEKRRAERKPDWMRRREDRRRDEQTYLREQRRRQTENGEWVTNVAGIPFKHADNRRSTPFIEGMNRFGSLDDNEVEEVPAVEAFPALPLKLANPESSSTPKLVDTAMTRNWSDVAAVDPRCKLGTPPLTPPKLKRSVAEFISPDEHVFVTPTKVCVPSAYILNAPKKKLCSVRWGDDSDDEFDDEPHEFSPTAPYEWGDGAW